MGNPMLNPTERAELQVLPNRDGSNSSSDTLMRDEVYAPKDLKETKELVQVSAKRVEQRLSEVFEHLESAKTLVAKSDTNAGKEYVAAIVSADKIDQPSVAREIRNIKLLLVNQNLDLQTRRLLVQEDADLHTLQRAPGFARANMALALIRNGEHADGAQLLLEAQQRDHLMLGDPNFQRHFKSANVDAANQHKVNYNLDPRELAPPTQPPPPPPSEGSRTRALPPSATALQLPREVPPPPPPPPTPMSTLREVPPLPTPMSTLREVAPPPTPLQATRDVHALGPQIPEVIKTEIDRPTPGTAASTLADAQLKFKQVVEQNGDVKGAYQQLAPQFLAAIGQADAEFAKAEAQASARHQQLDPSISAKLTPETKSQLLQIGAQIDAEKKNLPPAALDLWNKFDNPNTAYGERQVLQAQLEKTLPKLAQLANQIESTLGKDTLMNMMSLGVDDEKVRGALMGRFLTRYYLADAAATAGDQTNAQSQFRAAFESVPPDLQGYFARSKPEVEVLARNVGIDLRLLPAPPDATLSKALPPTALGNPGQREVTRPVGTTDDVSQPPVAGISPENLGLRADQIFDDARRSLQQGGMNEATKTLFADAIKVADSMYGPADQQATDNLIKSLQVGLNRGGAAMTAAERLEIHRVVQQEFTRATLGMQYRMVYAQALNQTKQYSSAEKVLQENIAVTDRLPLTSFQAELTQLGKDVQNPNINRDSQRDLFKMMQSLQGQGTSKDDGLLFMPITARKQAAYFYVGGADGSGVGIVKPEQAAGMIDDAIAKEKSLYGVEQDRVKIFDPSLARMAEGILPLLPENVRNMKMKADSFWSNALVDGGVAALAISGTMFIAGVLTRNGTLAKMGLASGEGTLNLGGKALVGASIIGGATYGRHEVHRMITGENESWDKSLIHGTAGVGEVAAIMGTRSLASKILYGGANVTPEAMLTRFSTERGVVALGERAAVTPTVGDFFVQMGSNGRRLTAEQAALRSSVAPILEGGVVNAEASAALSNLTRPQLANLTQTFIGESAAKGSHWYSRGNLAAGGKNLLPGPLDLTTATSGNLGVRSFYGNYAAAFNGIGTYSSVSSLDRGIDPKTGELTSYSDSLLQANYRTYYDNTAVDALWMGLFIMKDGAFSQAKYAEGAGTRAKAWGYFTAPVRPSALSIGALGEGASYGQLGLRAGQVGIMSTLSNGSTFKKWYEGGMEARAIGRKLDAMEKPIIDQSVPGATTQDTSVLIRSSKPAGQTDAPATKLKDNGRPIQDQPAALTRGTPGL